MIENSLGVVFLIGLLGGVHCAAMCGGVIGAMSFVVHRVIPIKQQAEQGAHAVQAPCEHNTCQPALPMPDLLAYNLGRISTYTLLGAVAGSIGSIGWLLDTWLPFQQMALVVTNVLLVLMGLYVAGFKPVGNALEALGAPLWKKVKPIALKRLPTAGTWNRFLAGTCWGLLPCGMLYGVLMTALLSQSAARGALLMAVFGLGTLPNLMLLGVSSSWLMKWRQLPWVRLGSGVFILLFGLVGLSRIDAVRSLPLISDLCLTL